MRIANLIVLGVLIGIPLGLGGFCGLLAWAFRDVRRKTRARLAAQYPGVR